MSSSAASTPPLLSKMDDDNIVEDIESTGNTTPSPLPQLQMGVRDLQDDKSPIWKLAFYRNLEEGDWEGIDYMLEYYPEAIDGPCGKDNDTPLVVAIKLELEMPKIQKFLDLTPPERLAMSSENGWSALHWAAFRGNLQVAKLLIEKNPELPNIRDKWGNLPIELAASREELEMTHFLLSVTMEDKKLPKDMANDVIRSAIVSGMYDLALRFLDYGDLSFDLAVSLLDLLVERPHAFLSGTRLNMLQSIIYSYIPINSKTMEVEVLIPAIPSQEHSTVQFSGGFFKIYSVVYQELLQVTSKVRQMLVRVRPIKNVLQLKQMHYRARRLLETFNYRHMELGPHFMLAVKNGITEIVADLVEQIPDLIKYTDSDRKTALQLAAEYRHEEIFSILHEKIKRYEKRQGGPNEIKHVKNYIESYGWFFMHSVAQRPRRNRLQTGSRVVLQMQHELQWYQEVEKLVPAELRFERNLHGKTPLEVFDEEHQNMAASEGEWMISMANSCIVGGSLIAAVVFAAAITVPGGNKDDGFPNFSKVAAFRVFAITDMFALIFSLTAVVIFLSIFTTRYSVNDFLYNLPNRLIIGLISLILSVTFMMIAFTATVYLVFAEKHDWIIYPTAAVSFIPVIFFAYLQLPSLLNMIKTTYRRGSIFKHRTYQSL